MGWMELGFILIGAVINIALMGGASLDLPLIVTRRDVRKWFFGWTATILAFDAALVLLYLFFS